LFFTSKIIGKRYKRSITSIPSFVSSSKSPWFVFYISEHLDAAFDTVSDDKIEVNCCGVVEHFTGYTCVAKKIQPDSEDYSTPTKKNGVAYAVGSFMTVSPRSVQNHPGLRAVAGCIA